ncbi:MAG: single-stranded DNA-binding protein [Christensenellales bacterium]|jgi:single-strand DNA-binding protein|nr:MAG TPA: Single strand binding protein [Caudoviricetes sp.]
MNKSIIIGRMTKDAEIYTTSGGIRLTRFSIAVTRDYADSNGDKQTDFFNCTAWRGLAEAIVKYVRKGDRIAIVGELQNRSYEDKAGVKRTVTEILVQEVEFLGNKQVSEDKPGETAYKPQKEGVSLDTLKPISVADDDLPF